MDKYSKLIKSASLQTGIDPKVGKVIMDNFFRYLKEVLKRGELEDPDSFDNIRIMKLGTFYSSQERRKRIRKRAEISANAKRNKI